MKKFTSNRNARIVNRVDRTGKLRTETSRRDNGFDFALSTDLRNNSTALYIDVAHEGAPFRLSGAEARTLYRLLNRHYDAVGK